MKSHNLIEKTAKFVGRYDLQMEILIKTKQSKNPQFDFLTFDSPLNPYYKHLVNEIKSGRYIPTNDEGQKSSDSETSDSDGEHYLHPSLLGSQTSKSSALILPTLPSFLSNSSYSQLVESLKPKIPTETESGEKMPNKDNSVNESGNIEYESKRTVYRGFSLLPPPPPELDLIIDKLAQYVAKNGEEFESTVRKRGEDRFEFLNPGNIHHAHYIRKKLQYLEEKRKTQASELRLKNNDEVEKGTLSYSD